MYNDKNNLKHFDFCHLVVIIENIFLSILTFIADESISFVFKFTTSEILKTQE